MKTKVLNKNLDIPKIKHKSPLSLYLSQLGNSEILTAKEEYTLTSKMHILKNEIIGSYLTLEYGRRVFIKKLEAVLNNKTPINFLYYGYNSIKDFDENNEISFKNYIENLIDLNNLDKVEEFIKYTKYFSLNLTVINYFRDEFKRVLYKYQANLNEIKRFLIKNGIPPLDTDKVNEIVNSKNPLTIITEFSVKKDYFALNILKKKCEKYLNAQKDIYTDVKLTSEQLKTFQNELKNYYNEIEKLRDLIAKANLRLVVSIAKRYRNRGLSLEDLIQEGNIGLLKSIDKFDYKKGNKLSTYATWWIKQSITRALEEKVRDIRIPSHVQESLNALNKFIAEYNSKYQKNPTDKEIIKALKIKPKDLKLYYQITKSTQSLDLPMKDDGNQLHGIVADENAKNPLKVSEEKELREEINILLSKLSPKEEKIIKLRFGLGDFTQKTLEEVGQEFFLTRERIRQIEKNALNKLKSMEGFKSLLIFIEN